MTEAAAASALLAVVQAAAKPGVWSQGVKLVREGAVSGVEERGGEVVFRVPAPGHAIAPTVTLFVDDEEWDCDCGGAVDPCAHVAAAAIAWADPARRAKLFERREEGHIAYRLTVRSRALALERVIVSGVEETRLTVPLADLVARRSPELSFSPTHDDLTVDRWLGRRPKGDVPPDALVPILSALSQARSLELDGEPVRASGEAIAPRAKVVDDAAGGVRLVIERDPRVTGVVAYGVVRAGDVLHPAAETQLTGLELEKLPIARRFASTELGELVTRVLPELSSRVEVDIQTARVPSRRRGAVPRIRFEIENLAESDQAALALLPSLVYGEPAVARIDGGKLVHLGGEVPVRDEPRELELVALLRDELNLVPGRRVVVRGDDALRMITRLDQVAPLLSGASSGGAPPAPLVRAGLVPRVVVDDDRVDVAFEVDADGARPPAGVTAGEVLSAWREGLGVVALSDGTLARLPADWLSRFGDRVADLLAARGERERVSPAALPLLGELCDDLELPRPAALARLAPLLEGFERIPHAALPHDLVGELRPYQVRGHDWLSFCRSVGLGAILADDMGLGKTLQAMCVLGPRSLVVCPRSVVFNWSAELARFRPGLSVSLYHGPKRALDERADVTLTTFATLRNDIDRLAGVEWGTVVLDEAQAIKNPDSQAARAAYRLRASFRLALTGTPIENRLDELWSQVHFTNPGLLGTRQAFASRFAEPIDRGDAEALTRLRARLRPVVLRRLKREVLPELPPRTEQNLLCELDDAERGIYDAVRAATRKEVIERLASGGGVMAALELLLRLRQAACHPALVPGQVAETSSKVERLKSALEEAALDGHKALVFSQWTGFLDLVEPHLVGLSIPFVRLDGQTRDRGAVVSAFQDERGPPVMLLSLKAGGVGLNLTAADHVFLLDPWWNPAVEDQAADRAHRIGQDRPVMVYRLVAKDTVEEGILALQDRKRKLAGAALDGAAQAASITREDLLALLESS